MIKARHLLAFVSAAALCAAAGAALAEPDQASSYGLFLAGQEALNSGQDEQASDYFARASAQDPATESIKSRAFIAALVAGDIPRAAQLAPKTGEGTVGEQELGRLTRAVEAIAENKGHDAQVLLASTPMDPPNTVAVQVLAPWAAAEAGDWKTALAPPAANGDHLVEQVALLDQALLLENRHRIDEADQAFRKLLAQSETVGIYCVAYGEFLERNGRVPDAISLYKASLAKDASDVLVQGALARAQANQPAPPPPSFSEGAGRALLAPSALLLAEKQPQLGLVYLRLVLRLDPNRDEGWLLVGDTLANAGDTAGAREAYAQPKPGSASYMAARARLIGTYDQPNDAATELQLAQETVKARPDDAQALTLLADALRTNGHYAQSAQVLDKLIDQAGANANWTLYYMRAVARDQAGDWPGAEKDLKQALTLNPDESEVLNYLGFSWIDRGENLKAAKAMIERAAAAKPDSGAIIDSLGWAYYRLGDYKAAVEQLERATQLEPADPDINNHLGDAYWRAGRKLEARFRWEQVLTLAPSDKLRGEVETKLKSGLDAAPAAVGATTAAAPAAPATVAEK